MARQDSTSPIIIILIIIILTVKRLKMIDWISTFFQSH